MATKINFTEAAIARIPAPSTAGMPASATKRTYYRDAKTAGLVLCVWSTGVKVFELYKRMGGRPTRLKIGRHPEISVEQARNEVARMIGELAKGGNPSQDRRKARAETTVGELFTMYLEGHAKPHKKSWQGDQDQFDRCLVVWKARRLSEIRPADVAALHAKIGRENGIYSANRLLALLSTMFTFAAGLGFTGVNPAKGVKRFKELSRDRFLHADEMQAFFEALHHEKTPALWQDFFAVALLTGARRSNVMAMKWADLELTRGLWRIPAEESKNAEPLICILHPAAFSILQRRRQESNGESEYVFPAPRRSTTGHVSGPGVPWKSLLARAGIKNLRIHDLRRTLGSFQAAGGASLSIIGKSLGHRSAAATAVYARLDLDPVRASVNAAGDSILAAANGETVKALEQG